MRDELCRSHSGNVFPPGSRGAQAYGAMRKMYCRIWARCHAVSSSMGRRPALPGLAAAFESLFEEVAPEVARHCARLGFDPLRPALNWMVHGFVGHLEVDQSLLLWDRVIGYDSLLPLAVVAAGVFLFMQRAILVRNDTRAREWGRVFSS